MKQIYEEAKSLQNELVAWRRHLHQNPELAMDIPNTSAFVYEKLRQMGYEPKNVAGYGLTVTVGKEGGKCFMIRGDMDALPIIEETGLEFKSKAEGKMHACGHDMHTTMLLGAAKLLKEHENEICGQVKLMFQPGEETLEGAKAMLADGILENPKVDAAAMFHVAAGAPIPSGVMVVPTAGVFTSASDWFEITVYGRGGHGAMPERAVDPINVMCQLYNALQSIRSRELASSSEAVITIGHVESGSTSNVIPDTAFMEGTIRTYSNEDRAFIAKRISEIGKSIGEALRADVKVKILQGCPSVINDATVTEDVRASLQEVFGAAVPDPEALGFKKLAGSEDFSFVTQEVPSVMMLISAGSIKEGYEYTQHHPKVRFNEDILCRGAAAYAIAAMGWLEKNQ